MPGFGLHSATAEAQRGAPRGVRRPGAASTTTPYRFRFTGAMFSRLDYFHPSLLGQATRRRDLAHVVVGSVG